MFRGFNQKDRILLKLNANSIPEITKYKSTYINTTEKEQNNTKITMTLYTKVGS
jgi:hypothetical protein